MPSRKPESAADMAPPRLADSTSCGEDLAENCRQTIAAAPESCCGCADYHIIGVLKRLVGKTVWERGARPALIDTVRPILKEAGDNATGQIDIVAAACADTAVISTCAHSAWLAGERVLDRTRFTVLDRCRTPLLLCEDYGARNGLDVRTETADLLELSKTFSADLIVVHNFLPFVPADHQASLLERLGSWLKPNGRLVIWNPVMAPDERAANQSTERSRHADIKTMIEDGRITINEPKETLFARLERNVEGERPGEQCFTEINSLPDLLESVGLKVRAVTEYPNVKGWRSKVYIMVVAGRP